MLVQELILVGEQLSPRPCCRCLRKITNLWFWQVTKHTSILTEAWTNKTFITGRRSTLYRCTNIRYIVMGLQFGLRWLSNRSDRAVFFWREWLFSDSEFHPLCCHDPKFPSTWITQTSIESVPNLVPATGQPPTLQGKLWSNYGGCFLGSSSPTEAVPWPARSPDMSPCNLKGKMYIDKPRDIPQLQNAIERESHAIPRRMCERVMTNFSQRLNEYVKNKGRHLNDIIFHVWQFFLNIPMVFLNCNISCIY